MNFKHRSVPRLLGASLIALVPAAAVPAAADAACKNYEHRAKVESDPFGTDLAYLYISKRVCFNGRRVTAVSKKLHINPTTTKNGGFANWHFVQFIGAPQHRYVKWHGRRKGSHYSYARAQFSSELGPYQKTADVWVSMRVFGNGEVAKDRHND